MAIFRWGPAWSPFHDLEREVDRLLESVHMAWPGLRSGRQFPALNLYELDDGYLLVAQMPGVRPDEFELTVADGRLTMSGVRRDPEAVGESRFRRQERFCGSWQRTVALPERIVEDGLRAELTNGVLRVHFPKAPTAEPRQIPVTEGRE
jgi:HSP20 family protein